MIEYDKISLSIPQWNLINRLLSTQPHTVSIRLHGADPVFVSFDRAGMRTVEYGITRPGLLVKEPYE